MTQEYKYIYKHTSNPWESNHRDGPTGHKTYITYTSISVIYKKNIQKNNGNKNILNKNERRCRDVKTQKAYRQGRDSNNTGD